jgi:uncharacterized membrane protein YqhA
VEWLKNLQQKDVKMKNIKIILLILSIGFLQSCKIYSENQRACNIDEMENIQ